MSPNITGVNPLNDYLFKYIFGRPERKMVTLSFINAVLGREGADVFVDLEFADRALDPAHVNGKSSELDFYCKMADGSQVNIEVQVQDRHNIEQRTLFYWARLYEEALNKGEDYLGLCRTVMINVLGYSTLPQPDYHNIYGLYDIASSHRLTEDIEIHFLELPKVTSEIKNLRGMRLLEKWMTYLSNKLSHEEMEELAMSEPAIKEAWTATDRFMRDKALRLAYLSEEMKEHDFVSAMNWERRTGLAEGRAEGHAEGRAEVQKGAARRMLRAKMPPAEIAALLDLPEETILAFAREESAER